MRRGLVGTGLAAEGEPQRVEVDPVAVAGADLLERGEQLGLGLGRVYADTGTASEGPISIPRYRFRPVAAGISLPMITFSLSPSRWSTLPSIDASVSTLVVSWKEAAERNDSVASDAFVMPRMSGS